MSGYLGRNQLMGDDPAMFASPDTSRMNPLLGTTLTQPQAPPPDAGALVSLGHVEAGPRANYMADADAAMNLTPQEKYLYQTHLTNLYGTGKIVHPDGGISSLLQMSFEGDNGRTYNIPTVWGGRQLAPVDAIRAAHGVGIDRFPSYATQDEAEARYEAMHDYLGRDTADFIDRSRGRQ